MTLKLYDRRGEVVKVIHSRVCMLLSVKFTNITCLTKLRLKLNSSQKSGGRIKQRLEPTLQIYKNSKKDNNKFFNFKEWMN